ncbi:TolC family protein [Deminuibacter soli]|uniref:TolC family protein n=1 Tax=Deminuibacter soli TaxID=2291815 RepID=A0A3E1NF47_9BACT|nr:TolC family protein [Deminuibacter soli]RFM26603.1 TolC family protein [Deminuibacter soli]
MRKSLLVLLTAAMPYLVHAQDKWDLRRCVDYAIQNNISVKQADVQARMAALTAYQAKGQIIPTLDFNTQGGVNNGRSVDPTSNLFTTQQVTFQSYNVQAGVTLFNWFSVRNNVMATKTDEEAYKLDVTRARSDVSLNVAAAYLQLLMAVEQVNIASAQIELSKSQLDLTRKQVDAGSMPELNAAQLESQLASDSSNYITATATAQQDKLQLLALLNLDAGVPFEVSLPDVDKIPLENLADLEPSVLYQTALVNQPLQKVNALHIKAGEYNVKSTRGAMYPTISAFASVGSNYASTYRDLTSVVPTGKFDTVAVVPVNGANYYALTPGFAYNYHKTPYFKQIGDINLTEAIGLSISIPILRNRQLRTNYQKAKLNVENLKLTQEQANQKLQQDIYTAYSNAVTGIQKYNANKKANEYSEYAYELSKKRYDIGMSSTLDYLTALNNLSKARINMASAHYEYIFRLKVLEFYKLGTIRL